MAPAELDREPDRNATLRRADWRVLLASPQPAKTICFATGRLAAAVERISGATIHARTATTWGADFDLAVAVDPSRTTLDAAVAALHPGGSCYTEWYGVRPGGVSRIRHWLERAGLEDVRCYWAWPSPARSAPAFWLPLSAPGALRFFIESRTPARSPFLRVLYAVRRSGWRLAARAGLIAPICATATKPGAPNQERLVARVALQSEQEADGDLSVLLLTGGPRSVSKVTALAFREPASTPLVAIKLSRTPEAASLLRHEARVLGAVACAAPSLDGVPRFRSSHDEGGLFALAESPAVGTPLNDLIDRKTYGQLALKATTWLGALAGRQPAQPRLLWWDRLVIPVVTDFRRFFQPIIGQDLFRAADEALDTLGNLPLVIEHRDYAPWNILVGAGGRLHVLDWEGAELRGLPGLDLIYFLAYLAFFHDGAIRSGRYRESYGRCFDKDTFTGRISAECEHIYAATVGMDLSAWRALRVFVWMSKALSEYRRFAEDCGGPPTRKALQTSLFVALWKDELARRAHA